MRVRAPSGARSTWPAIPRSERCSASSARSCSWVPSAAPRKPSTISAKPSKHRRTAMTPRRPSPTCSRGWDSEGAERVLERGVAKNPGSRALRDRLFQVYADRGDMAKLADLHERTAEGSADDQAARLREAARLFGELGRPADATRVLSRL